MKTVPCRACGAELLFIKTQNGKTIPCDAESRRFYACEDGKELFVLADGRVKRGRTVPMELDGADIGFISHFATCPEADKFRKPRKSRKKG